VRPNDATSHINKIVSLLGAKSGGVIIRIEPSDERLTAFVDRIQIQQVVVNRAAGLPPASL
jgi:hypothetical protein